MRPQGHPEHPLFVYHLLKALIWPYSKENTTVHLYKSAQLSCRIAPLSRGHLRSIAAGENDVDYVIDACNDLLIDSSDEDIQLRRLVLVLCPMGNMHRSPPRACTGTRTML
jgi:hypothetical protein